MLVFNEMVLTRLLKLILCVQNPLAHSVLAMEVSPILCYTELYLYAVALQWITECHIIIRLL